MPVKGEIRPVEDRFFEKVVFSDNWHNGTRCLDWQAGTDSAGYGAFTVKATKPQKQVGAHRWLYERWVGPIPQGLHLDHLCRRRCCVNPDHLEPVTCEENLKRSPVTQATLNMAKTHCKWGHLFDEENTFTQPNGSRGCRTCARRRTNASYAKKKQSDFDVRQLGVD